MRLKLTGNLPHVLLLIFSLQCLQGAAQYFGRNKVLYQNFDFSVYQTTHFDIYTYLLNDRVRNKFATLTEQWYSMHHSVLKDSFRTRNPLLVYNHHADFQQTRAIEGRISVGTGGVTEALKNRVVLPFMESNAQTDHVLGHELVHAFQYHIIKDSLNINAINKIPLWMVEGMAEYMSTGSIDANTAMWLRSAVAHDRLPSLKELTSRPDLYFPYRWGQAFWSYVTGIRGDSTIKRLFIETGKKGYTAALKSVFGIDEATFSRQWQESIRKSYGPYEQNTEALPPGINMLNKKNAGSLNIVPSVSPNGKYIAFWTEKNLFSIDLYVADAVTGKIVKRITTNSFNARIDQYNSFESSVAWSPDSKQIAFVAFAKGHARLLIAEMNGKVTRSIDLPGVHGFSNPAWSPDGKTIVVTGLVEGQSDLYAYNLLSGKLRQLTNDLYADLQPSFSPDGKWIVFASDRLCLQGNPTPHRYAHNIALLNTASGAITNLDFFPGTNNLNPVFAPGSDLIYFLSDRDGFRNLYSYELSTKQLVQQTRLFSGISGITLFAPAISMARQSDLMVFSYYDNGNYTIHAIHGHDLEKSVLDPADVNMTAAMLPPFERTADMVQRNMEQPQSVPATALKQVPFRSGFSLDYLGNTGVGIQSGGGGYGTGLAGGVGGVFSDMLGDHQLFAALSLNGEIIDVAGQFAYLNQKHRFNWGVSVSHIPYLSGAQYLFRDTLVREGDTVPVLNYSLDLLRTFEDQVSVFASYPFSTVRRLEAGASFSRFYYRLDRYTEYYDETGYFIESRKEKQKVPKGFNLAQAYVALVGDNSFFGVASPLTGHRFRLEAGQYIGVVKMSSVLADYRKYFRFAPFSLASRNVFMGRYGNDASGNLLPPLFLGYSSLVRGYDALQYATDNNSPTLTINDLIGSKIYVSNIELRFPFSGPERLSLVKSRFFFTELNLFTDGGIAWGKSTFLRGPGRESFVQENAKFVLSTGLSLRLNLFGYLVVEPYYAIPWQNGGWHHKSFGVNIVPGW